MQDDTGYPGEGWTKREAALWYAARGWRVLPLHTPDENGRCSCQHGADCRDAGKHPRTMRGVKAASSDDEVVAGWWDVWPDANIGIATGRPFAFVVDEDVPDAVGDQWPVEAGELATVPIVRQSTPNGTHFLFAADEDFGNSTGGRGRSLGPGIDTRGDGGYIVVAPSVTPAGTYRWRSSPIGPWASLPEPMKAALRPKPVSRMGEAHNYPATVVDRDRLGRWVASAVARSADEVRASLEGARNHTLNEVAFRLGTIGAHGEDVLTESTAFAVVADAWDDAWSHAVGPDGRPSQWQSFHKTWSSGWSAGTRSPREPWPPFEPDPVVGFSAPLVQLGAPAAESAGAWPALDPWEPEDLTDVLDGTRERVTPSIGRRSDGVAVLYPGKEHVVAGEPESGKTWFALSLVRDVLVGGGRVVYVDFEDDALTVVGRLTVFGMPRSRFENFRYVAARTVPTKAQLHRLVTWDAGPADLVVYDGWTEGASLLGLDIMSQTDIAKWREWLIKPVLDLGCATLTTDHVTKDKETRGRYGIGAQHKLAGLTGAMFITEVQQTWGKGNKGRSRVLLTKDRNGSLRPHGERIEGAANITHFADLVGNAESGEMVSVVLYKPYGDQTSPDGLTERDRNCWVDIVKVWGDSAVPVSGSQVADTVPIRRSDALAMVPRLVAANYLIVVPAQRGVKYLLNRDKFPSSE